MRQRDGVISEAIYYERRPVVPSTYEADAVIMAISILSCSRGPVK